MAQAVARKASSKKASVSTKAAKIAKPLKGSYEAIVAAAAFARKKGLENFAR